MQKGALIARNTKRKKAGKDKNRFLSSTLSTQHELIKHEQGIPTIPHHYRIASPFKNTVKLDSRKIIR